MGSNKVAVISVGDTSAGNIRLSIEKDNGYDTQFWMEHEEARYLFNRLGRLLGELNDD